MYRIVVLGGSGLAGRAIAALLARHTNIEVVLAGRNQSKVAEVAAGLGAGAISVDAGDRVALRRALDGARMVVVASSTIEHTATVAAAAIDTGADYFDIQLSSRRKLEALERMRPQIEMAGRCFLTDGGYHPGLPAALVRYLATQFDQMHTAPVSSVMRMPWKQYSFTAATVDEFQHELRDYRPAFFEDGSWAEGWSKAQVVDFGEPFGSQRCTPMGLAEMRLLPDAVPGLRETGFYANAFDAFTSNAVIPLCYAVLTYIPRLAPLVSRLLPWSMATFAKPPFGIVMVAEAAGVKDGAPLRLRLRLGHEDGYTFTAVPAVACLMQYLDGSIARPGIHYQACAVEPVRFLADLKRLGLEVEEQEWEEET